MYDEYLPQAVATGRAVEDFIEAHAYHRDICTGTQQRDDEQYVENTLRLARKLVQALESIK